jgi:hypothetical protein
MLHRTSPSSKPAIRFLSWLRFLLREILLESRIALRLILFRHTNKQVLRVVDFGPDLEATPTGLVGCNRTHSRIRDKLIFDTKYSWATTQIDALLFLEAWEMGAKWGENKQRMAGMDTLIDLDDLDPTPIYENKEKTLKAAREVISRQGL